MNHFKYDELEVGYQVEFSKTITEDMMNHFREISGDVNPLHIDANFAKLRNFPNKVVFGMLSASLYSTLAGVYLPGENCLLQAVHADFLAPVYVGDNLTVSGKLVEKYDSVRQLVIKAVIRNQDCKKVSKARIEAGVLE